MLSDYFEPFIRMTRHSHADPMTGTQYTYTDGETFLCGCATNAQTPAEVASQQAVKVTYTLFLPDGVLLAVGDLVRRVKTGDLLKVVTNPVDMQIPTVSSMRYSVCTAEVAKQ